MYVIIQIREKKRKTEGFLSDKMICRVAGGCGGVGVEFDMEKAIRKKIKEGVGYGILQVEKREDVYILYPPGPQVFE